MDDKKGFPRTESLTLAPVSQSRRRPERSRGAVPSGVEGDRAVFVRYCARLAYKKRRGVRCVILSPARRDKSRSCNSLRRMPCVGCKTWARSGKSILPAVSHPCIMYIGTLKSLTYVDFK